MIEHFSQGQMWEHALDQCWVLATQYEEELGDSYAMAEIRKAEAELYENIMTRLRPEPEYFRVAFYRGRGFERLPDFHSCLLDQVLYIIKK